MQQFWPKSYRQTHRLLDAVAAAVTDADFDGGSASESSLALLSLKMLFILDLSTALDVGVDVASVDLDVTGSLLTTDDVTAASLDGWTIGLAVDGDDCDAGDSDARAAASVAARLACLALAASLRSEKSPLSESGKVDKKRFFFSIWFDYTSRQNRTRDCWVGSAHAASELLIEIA